MTGRVVAVLGRGVVPADVPLLRADDLGVLRGDGVFESLHVRGGRPWLLDAHLARMAGSAARLALDLPAPEPLAELAATACTAWPDRVEGALRLVCTRGPEPAPGSAPAGPTVFATISAVPAPVRELRRTGLAVASVSFGLAAGARRSAPWLLGGVKAVSYAVNMASQRWAHAHSLDDVLWVSTDGYALEGPTSTLVWLAGDTLCTVPVDQTGILPGTTARWLLDHAGQLGLQAADRMIRPAELAATDGVWLVSSIRGGVPVRTLDGVALPDPPHAVALRDLLGYPV